MTWKREGSERWVSDEFMIRWDEDATELFSLFNRDDDPVADM
jgi:hypothetical protein